MKKRIALLLAAVLCLALAGCGSVDKKNTVSETRENRKIAVGDSYTFGAYEQDNDTSNGIEPIEWIVPEKRSDGLASLLYTVVNNHILDEEYIGIALVDAYVDTSKLDSDADILLTRGKSYDGRLKKLEFIGIFYSSLSYDEMSQYSAQIYSVQLMAGECDIFIQDKSMTDTLLEQDFFVALDTLDSYSLFIEKFGEKKCEELFVWSEISVEGEEGDDAHTERHAYSIDISSLTGLITRNAYDCRGKYASILSRSANADTALYVLFEMFNIMGEAA